MLTSIIQSLSTAFGDILEAVMNAFLTALGMNLSSYLDVFPLLATAYSILRSFSVGMIAVIAGKSLASFWFGSVEGTVKDRPEMVLLRTFFAVLAVYWGGYVLEYIVHLGSIPYDRFLNLDAANASTTTFDWKTFSAGLLTESTGLGIDLAIIGDLAISMISLLMTIIIGWNLFKLVIEICERWLIVGVMVFTSPIIYCTIPSSTSSSIFKKWVGMFIGSVIQMSLSVMFLKLILSGFNGHSQVPTVMKLFMILAMCKIAQRLDTYLQQIGVGVATTGGSMLDDLIAGARGLSGLTRHASRGGVLGSGASGTLRGRTPLGRGISTAAGRFQNGDSFADSVKAGARATAQTWQRRTGFGRAYAAYNRAKAEKTQDSSAPRISAGRTNDGPHTSEQTRRQNNEQNWKTAGNVAREWVHGSAAGAGMAVAPNVVGNHDSTVIAKKEKADQEAERLSKIEAEKKERDAERQRQETKREEQQKMRDQQRKAESAAATNAETVAEMRSEYQSGGAVMPDDIREAAEQAKQSGISKGLRNFTDNYKEYGIIGESGNVFEINDDGDVVPSTPAVASGISLGNDDTLTDKCGGKAVSEWMSRCISESGINSDGTMSFSAMPSKDDYVRQNTAPEEEYLDAGNRIAAAEHKKDEEIVSRYENSMPETKQLRFAAEKAEMQLEKLREVGAEQKQIHAAEERVQEAQASIHRAAEQAGEKQYCTAEKQLSAANDKLHEAAERVSVGKQRVADTKQRLDHLESINTPHNTREYLSASRDLQRAQNEYAEAQSEYLAADSHKEHSANDCLQKKAALEEYRNARRNLENESHYREVAYNAANELKSSDQKAAAATYDSAKERMSGVLDSAIRSTDVYTKSRALNDPNRRPADIEPTRLMAYDVFKDAIPDLQPNSGFLSVKARDINPRSDNYGKIEMQGGRLFQITYSKTDGSIGRRVFYNGVAATALPPEFAVKKYVYTSPDGGHWLTDDNAHRTAPQRGRRIKENRALISFFATAKRRNRQ